MVTPSYDIIALIYVGQAFSGQRVAVNGSTGELRLQARPGEHVRLRLIGALEGEQFGPLMMLAELSSWLRSEPATRSRRSMAAT